MPSVAEGSIIGSSVAVHANIDVLRGGTNFVYVKSQTAYWNQSSWSTGSCGADGNVGYYNTNAIISVTFGVDGESSSARFTGYVYVEALVPPVIPGS